MASKKPYWQSPVQLPEAEEAQPKQSATPPTQTATTADEKPTRIDGIMYPTEPEPTAKAPTATEQPVSKPKEYTYAEIVKQMYPDHTTAPMDDERLARKRKREAVISAVGDGISALANVASATAGATPYTPTNLSAANQARWDTINKEREARRDSYRQAYARALLNDQEARKAAEQAERKARKEAEDEAWERQKFQSELAYKQWLAGMNDQTKRDIAQGHDNTSRANTQYRATHTAKSSGSTKHYPWEDSDGNVHSADTKYGADFWARKNGTYVEPEPTESTSTHIDSKGNVSTSKTQTKRTSGHVGATPKKKKNPLSEISIRE
jgi:hypothetical protein